MKFFLDLGAHYFEGLDKMVSEYQIDSTWEVHSFEPNPDPLVHQKIRQEIELRKNININFHAEAVGESDAMVRYEHVSNLGDIANNTRSWFSGCSTYATVKQIDFSCFLEGLDIKEEDFVVCKCDVEGSEFYLLDHLIKKGTINLIDHLYVEWHAENQWGHEWPTHLSDEQIIKFKNIKNQVKTALTQTKVFDWD
jgi:FkbM family methyltransferase